MPATAAKHESSDTSVSNGPSLIPRNKPSRAGRSQLPQLSPRRRSPARSRVLLESQTVASRKETQDVLANSNLSDRKVDQGSSNKSATADVRQKTSDKTRKFGSAAPGLSSPSVNRHKKTSSLTAPRQVSTLPSRTLERNDQVETPHSGLGGSAGGAPSTLRSGASYRREGHQRATSGTTMLSRTTSTNKPKPEVLRTPAKQTPLTKPAFSTLQQHYSPKKKALSETSASSAECRPSSTGTIRLQNLLLQMDIMYRESMRNSAQSEQMARDKMAKRFARLVREDNDLTRRECEAQKIINQHALETWLNQPTRSTELSRDKDERIRSLLDTLRATEHLLLDPNSTYQQTLRTFKDWISEVEDARQNRLQPMSTRCKFFDSGLDEKWHGDISSAGRKAASLQRRLEDLQPQSKDQSHLCQIIERSLAQVKSIISETDGMESLEKAVVKAERDHIDHKVSQIHDLAQEASQDQPQRRPLWSSA